MHMAYVFGEIPICLFAGKTILWVPFFILFFCISVFQTGNKYAEKGKELLAKIVFYRQSEDKQKLTPEA